MSSSAAPSTTGKDAGVIAAGARLVELRAKAAKASPERRSRFEQEIDKLQMQVSATLDQQEAARGQRFRIEAPALPSIPTNSTEPVPAVSPEERKTA